MAAQVALEPVDEADVTILVDNAIDILTANTEIARRPTLAYEWSEREQLRAEHGYALHVSVTRDGRRQQILYDAGLSRDALHHNLDVLDVKLGDIASLVLSHGHADHHGGLEGVMARAGRRSLPMILHPDAWLERRVVFPTGAELHLPGPSHNDIEREGWRIVEERAPSLLLEGSLLVTGQVERTTDFEKGMPVHQKRAGDAWEPDTWIWDDQGIVFNVRDRGLVVLSSCSHAGAINVMRHAKAITGVDKLHAFVGGFHLTGGSTPGIIPRTVAELANLAPDYVVPGHCTGWQATALIATTLPDAYVMSSVGTRLHFAAPDMPA
jgi:7,8-dihydropterin-6-yl-methyl-4-(beta-D-ribofuranosyl)aminobenzene 5'-phosphate synthase